MKKPKSYYCHKSSGIQHQLGISDNFQVVQKIGEGAFGQVFKVFDTNSSQLGVIKRHKQQSSQAIINKQNQIMREMSGSQGFAKIKDLNSYSQSTESIRDGRREGQNTVKSQELKKSGQYKNQLKINSQYSIQDQLIMMECLGENLGKVVERKTVSIYTMKRMAEQLIYRLRELHQKNYVHRDLKPENILLGNQLNPHKIYLVDFGLVSTYRKDPRKVRKIYDGIIGTAKFCPLASHQGNQQFPKDDLQSLGYVLVYLVQGDLPWRFKQQMTDQQKFQKMGKIKQNISIQQLTKGLSCLKKYFTYVNTLTPSSIINYSQLLQMFKTESNQQYCFQFCKQTCFYKFKKFASVKTDDIEGEDKSKLQGLNSINVTNYKFKSKFIKN